MAQTKFCHPQSPSHGLSWKFITLLLALAICLFLAVKATSQAAEPDKKSGTPAATVSPEQTKATAKAKEISDRAAVLKALAENAGRGPLSHGERPSLFGLEGEGKRFVYVLDRSGSMGDPENKPIQAARAELIRSVKSLDDVQQFFIVHYNHEPRVFNPTGVRGRLIYATDENQKSAEQFIDHISPEGGTNHYKALQVAIKLRPDAIFMLTDGEEVDDLTADELAKLQKLNEGLAQIHVVQFSQKEHSSNSLVELAKKNRGKHRYLNPLKLDNTSAE
ncbi:MAG: VWA domain-containing protein [Planctomycetota bacterium]|nr:VWA domain-containing protein [Planctomycetota bacterium]